ncbi:hypothetical protein V1525DRAFT_417201 [Lipomyces kononenkoae]|uniref:Uncharacterized protein n=1 Tax=Lipomyces kononenkoae TaxID=34357 RepID=A0ACC3T9G4_LIPKO
MTTLKEDRRPSTPANASNQTRNRFQQVQTIHPHIARLLEIFPKDGTKAHGKWKVKSEEVIGRLKKTRHIGMNAETEDKVARLMGLVESAEIRHPYHRENTVVLYGPEIGIYMLRSFDVQPLFDWWDNPVEGEYYGNEKEDQIWEVLMHVMPPLSTLEPCGGVSITSVGLSRIYLTTVEINRGRELHNRLINRRRSELLTWNDWKLSTHIQRSIGFRDSFVSMYEGPTAIVDDYLYRAHHQNVVRNVSVVDGRISVHLGCLGTVLCAVALPEVPIIAGLITAVAASLAPQYRVIIQASIALTVALGAYMMRAMIILIIGDVNLHALWNNDIRCHTKTSMKLLLGLTTEELEAFLILLSKIEPLGIRGTQNCYIIKKTSGPTEVEGVKPARLILWSGSGCIGHAQAGELALITTTIHSNINTQMLVDNSVLVLRYLYGMWHISKMRHVRIDYDDDVTKRLKIDDVAATIKWHATTSAMRPGDDVGAGTVRSGVA